MKNFLAYSLTRLGIDHIDIYRPARLDPAVPIEETVGAIKEMIDAGYVRHIGLSEVDADDDPPGARRAPDRRPADRVLADLPRGGGGGAAHAAGAGHRHDRVRGAQPRPDLRALDRRPRAGPGDRRGLSPRFADGNVEHNLALVEALRRVAEAKGCTVAQLAIAWVAAQGEDIVPLVGARTRERLAEALPATELTLTADDLAEIEKAVPAGRGPRRPLPGRVHGRASASGN